jgi:methionine sulfoxide reductase heme-binding subunit
MKRFSFTPLQILAHVGSWVPAIVLAFDYFGNRLGVNPIQALEIRTGDIAIVLLLLSLAITPLNTLLRLPALAKLRRPLGVYGYTYAVLHLLIFTGVDYGFDFGLILMDVGTKPYILAGLATFLVLTPLAITSLKYWMARLGKKWRQLHNLVYLANLLVVLHFGWSVKGDFLLLRGDVFRPLLAGLAVLALLALRIPAVRKRAAGRLHGLVELARRIPPMVRPIVKTETAKAAGEKASASE